MQCNAMWCGTLCNVTTASKWSAYSMLRRVEWIQSNSIQFNSMDSHLLRDITRQRDEPNATFLQNLYDSIAIVLNFKKRKHADHKWMSVLLIPKETHNSNSNSNNNTWSFDNHCIALHRIASIPLSRRTLLQKKISVGPEPYLTTQNKLHCASRAQYSILHIILLIDTA